MSNLLYELAAGPRIAVNIEICKAVGGLIPGAMLSQTMYWCRKKAEFWKTDSEWMDELTVSKRQVQKARQVLLDLGVIEVEKRGVPCRNFYRINETKLVELLAPDEAPETFNPMESTPVVPDDDMELSTGTGSTSRHTPGQVADTGRVKWLARGGSSNQRLSSKITPKKLSTAWKGAHDDPEVDTAEKLAERFRGCPPDADVVDKCFRAGWRFTRSGVSLAETSARQAILRRLAVRWGPEWASVLCYVMSNWGAVVHIASRDHRQVNLKKFPLPKPEAMTALADHCLTAWKRKQLTDEPDESNTSDDWSEGLSDDF